MCIPLDADIVSRRPSRKCSDFHSWCCQIMVQRACRQSLAPSLCTAVAGCQHRATMVNFGEQGLGSFSTSGISQEWYPIPLSTIQDLYLIISRRIQAVFDVTGNPALYSDIFPRGNRMIRWKRIPSRSNQPSLSS